MSGAICMGGRELMKRRVDMKFQSHVRVHAIHDVHCPQEHTLRTGAATGCVWWKSRMVLVWCCCVVQ